MTAWTCPACAHTETSGHKAHTACPKGNPQDDSADVPAVFHEAEATRPRTPEPSRLPQRDRRVHRWPLSIRQERTS
ncbi:Uncharacterised protein [Nocardiopsis dassonvillei]|uniref:Uncharacterized protein n=1 Tax=Nocardiopsis dassonvillei (strain ATCC 23218 / DSM 43111 / CIP 107115 / JCM 7437 / KCTC 9190 / NBRC 14626 / NCTC 10488 / NRRL B-5397 / IMRU 509) TaxID=446468 RepID=D7AX87_NOCDD|nr:hypothetical protein Ndas_0514 [Nocardiopsis dassonvillei subsp. dassonvillei DSM 43111]VEI91983.1 Uncharacterised protein [Nocardiopsis dassonvillei]